MGRRASTVCKFKGTVLAKKRRGGVFEGGLVSHSKKQPLLQKLSMLYISFTVIFFCDMFYFMEDFEIVNDADDSTPFSAKLNHKLVVEELEISSPVLFL